MKTITLSLLMLSKEGKKEKIKSLAHKMGYYTLIFLLILLGGPAIR